MSVYTPLPDGTIRLLSPFKALYHVFQPGLHLTAPVCISTYVPPPNKTVNFSAQRSTDQFSRNFFTFKRIDGIPTTRDSILNEGLALRMYRPAIGPTVGLLPSYSLDITVTKPGKLRIYKLERELEVAIDLCDNLTVYCVHTGKFTISVPFLDTFYLYSEDAEISNLRATAIVPVLYPLTISPVVTLTTRCKKYEVAWTVDSLVGTAKTGCYHYEPTPDWEVVANAIKKTFTHYQIPVPLTPIIISSEPVKPIILTVNASLVIGNLDDDCALLGGETCYGYVSRDNTADNVQGLFLSENNDVPSDITVSNLRVFLSSQSAECNLPEGLMLGALTKEGDGTYTYDASRGTTRGTVTNVQIGVFNLNPQSVFSSNGRITLLKRTSKGLSPYTLANGYLASWNVGPSHLYWQNFGGPVDCVLNDCILLWYSPVRETDMSRCVWNCEYTYYNQGNVQGK